MRGGLCGKLHGGRSQLLFAVRTPPVIDLDRQLFVENPGLFDMDLTRAQLVLRWPTGT